MAENVEDIIRLLERLKNETELNAHDFSNLLLDIKLKLENMDGDYRDNGAVLSDLKKLLESKSFEDENRLTTINDRIKQLRSLLENTTTTADYVQLSEEIKALSSNFKDAVESIIKFANQDTESKNVLFEKVSALEKAVDDSEVIDIVKAKSEDLIKSYEGLISDINLHNGNIISSFSDLKQLVDDSFSQNAYLINSFGNKLDENSERISSLSETVSSNLSNVNSKLYSLGDDVQKTLSDGFEHLKYLSSNLSEYMNSNSLDLKTTLECLRANVSDYSEQLKVQIDDFNSDIGQKIVDSSNIQTSNTQSILSQIKELGSEVNNKSMEYDKLVKEKTSEIIDFINAYKDAVTALKDENNAVLAEKLLSFGEVINSSAQESEKAWGQIQTKLDEASALISETSDSILLGVVNSNSEIINELKNDLLTSSSANLDKIVAKIDETNSDINKFKEVTAENLSEYLTAIKDLFIDFSNNLDASSRDDEIIEKISAVENLISEAKNERQENFEFVKTNIVECKDSINSVSKNLQQFTKNSVENINDLKSFILSLSNSSSVNSDSLNNLEKLINEKSLSKDEQLEIIRKLLEENNVILSDITSTTQEQKEDLSLQIVELKKLVSDTKDIQLLFSRIEELINATSAERDNKINSLKDILTEYKNSVDQLVGDIHINSGNLLSELSDLKESSSEIIPKIETLKSMEDNLNGALLDSKLIIQNDIVHVKDTIDEIKNEVKTISGKDNSEIIDKLEVLSCQIKDFQIGSESLLSELSDLKDANSEIAPKIDSLKDIEGNINGALLDSKIILQNDIIHVKDAIDGIKKELQVISDNDNSDILKKIDCVESQLNDFLICNGNLLSELSDLKNLSGEIIPRIESVRDIETSLNDAISDSKLILQNDIAQVKISIEDIKENVRQIAGADNSDILNKLSLLETQFNDSSIQYEQAIESVRIGIAEYTTGIENINTETNKKLDSSLEELETLKSNFNSISEKMTTLIGDSGLIEILANIRQQFNVVIEQIHNEKEGQTIELHEALSNSCNSISSNLYLIGQNLEAVRLQQSDNSEYLRGNFEEKLLSIQSEVTTITDDIKNVIDEKNNNFISNFESLKESVDKFVSFNFGDIVSEIKNQVEVSYINLLNEFKETIDQNPLFSKVEDTYKESILKFEGLESYIHDTSESNFELINQTLLNITETLQHNFTLSENLQNKLETDLLRIENSIQENKISMKSSLVDLLEDIKKYLTDSKRMEMEDFRSAVLPLLDNEELFDVIKNLNRGLAERLEEIKQDETLAAQDILDVVNSISNTVDYTLDVINEKFENNSSVQAQIDSKLNEINTKLDIFAMDDNSDIVDGIAELSNNIAEVNQKIEQTVSYKDSLNEVLSKLDALIASEGQVVGEKFADIKDLITEIQNNFENKINLIALEGQSDLRQGLDDLKHDIGLVKESTLTGKSLEDLLKTIDNKVDIIAADDSSDITDDLQEIKEYLSVVKTNLEENKKLEDLIGIVDNKLDVLAQFDNESEIDEIRERLLIIEQVIKSSDLNDLVKTIDNKIDILAQSDSENDINEIKDRIVSIEQSLKSSDLDDIVRAIDSKVDILSQEDNTEIIDSIEQVNEKLDNIKANTESSLALEDLINQLHSKVDVLAMSDEGDIQEEISSIKELIEAQISSDNAGSVNNSLQKLLHKISEIDLSKQASEIKDSIIEAVVSVSNEISFVEETEEIKDFVNEKTNDIHRTLMEVKHQLSNLTCSGDDMDFYSYTLQDVESDIAKLRLILKDMSGESSTNEICVISNNISKMSKAIEGLKDAFEEAERRKYKGEDVNEQILSISSRLNQLILNKKEIDDIVLRNLRDTRERLDLIDNTAITKGIESVLVSMDEKLSYSANLNTVLKNVMMYLGEWMDGTTETISSIYNKTSKISSVEDALKSLRDALPEKRDLINFIETKFAQQESRIDRIERQLDKLTGMLSSRDDFDSINRIEEKLSKLSVSVEKLASYVE